MKYKELLELYKQGKLEAEQRGQVEQDIQRHEAISEYLFEEDPPGLDEFIHYEKGWNENRDSLSDNMTEQKKDKKAERLSSGSRVSIRRVRDGASCDEVDLKFARMIHRSIRRAFVKLGVTVVVIVIAFVLFSQFALPHIVDAMYYQPDKILTGNWQTKQLDLDMSVYTEMFVPQQHRMTTQVESRGFGKYDILVYQTYSVNGNFVDVAGRIDKGEIIFYNHNVILPPTGNTFAWSGFGLSTEKALSSQISSSDNQVYCASGSPEDARASIEELDDNTYYNAFVTLDQVMEYEDFISYTEKSENMGSAIWCAPIVSENQYDWNNIGFFCSQPSSSSMDWDNENYPNLVLWYESVEEELDMTQEANALEHFTSMLDYMNDQEKFTKMMDVNTVGYESMKKYVRENGLSIYGFMTIASKEQILGLMDEEEVYTIYTTTGR